MLLLERDVELALIGNAVDAARSGRGSLVLVSAPAGIGKTAVLAAAARDAAGVRRLAARGGELERELPLGIARQLLEPALAELEPAAAARLLDGAGAAADAILGRGSAGERDPAAILHGLHRLVVNVAAERPLLLEVDDVQWADAASLRFLAFVAHRIAALPVALVLAQRSGEASTDQAALQALAGQPQCQQLGLAPLSLQAATRLVAELAERAVDEEFCRACHGASAGNPFLLRELLHALRERGVTPDARGATRVLEAGPPAVARWVSARLARLPASASALARAVAVLGQDADLGRAARLAELSLRDAETALDGLVESELLAPGRPLDFVHPVLRAAVHDAIPPGSRSAAHRRAAWLLRDQDAAPGAVAMHLLASEPAAQRWVAEALLAAAHVALGQGVPELAARHVQRALAEPPPTELRAALLRTLGNAERHLGRPSANGRFLAALNGTVDVRERAQTVLDLAIAAPFVGEIARARAAAGLVRHAMCEVEPIDVELALLLRAELIALEMTGTPSEDELRVAEDELRVAERTLAAYPENTPAARRLATMLAGIAAWRGRPRQSVLVLAQRAVGDDDSYTADLEAGYLQLYAIGALAATDELALPERRLTQAVERAERRGSVIRAVFARARRACIRVRAGALEAAEADGRRVLELGANMDLETPTVIAASALVEALVERGELDAAEAVLRRHGLAEDPSESWLYGVATAPSRLRLATGQAADAHANAIAVGRVAETKRLRNPAMSPWRSQAALALIALGRPAEARELAEEELAIAEAADIPSAIGAARRVVALATGADAAILLLRDAVAVLEQAPVPLELARALTDLGAALRRTGQRQAAREPLARALELAHRHGAALLVDTARTELLATGARPRRETRTGVDALTPSEHRVAQLAAGGLSNAHIATQLFITTKTVEHHLAAVYQKLNIRSRGQLPPALDTASPPKTSTAALASDHASLN
jgi:DNA-binding CsgD family transcriptional regulator